MKNEQEIAILCPNCNKKTYAFTKTPLWVMQVGRISIKIDCSNCNFKKKINLISLKKLETMMPIETDI